jgi:hypothetical protein
MGMFSLVTGPPLSTSSHTRCPVLIFYFGLQGGVATLHREALPYSFEIYYENGLSYVSPYRYHLGGLPALGMKQQCVRCGTKLCVLVVVRAWAESAGNRCSSQLLLFFFSSRISRKPQHHNS